MGAPVPGEPDHLVASPLPANPPELGGAAVGEIGVRAAREDCGDPLAMQTNSAMTQSEDALMQL